MSDAKDEDGMLYTVHDCIGDDGTQDQYTEPVGFTLADVHEFVRSERLTRERYNELRAKLLAKEPRDGE